MLSACALGARAATTGLPCTKQIGHFDRYFRAPETTIEFSRSPLRIYGIDSRYESIIVRGKRDGREFRLTIAKWPTPTSELVSGAVPGSTAPLQAPQPSPLSRSAAGATPAGVFLSGYRGGSGLSGVSGQSGLPRYSATARYSVLSGPVRQKR